jgi:5-methylcytosine-specific restriction endonuclease McrA
MNEYDRSGGRESSTSEMLRDEDRRAGDTETSIGTMGTSPQPVGATQLERRARVEFTAREIVMSKLERVRSIASHRLPANAPLERVIEFLADYFTEREDPAKRHERREVRKGASHQPASHGEQRNPTYIPAPVRDQIFVRDKNQCTYLGPNGRRCGSTYVLQIDHITPVARGGASSIHNLRLLCAHHNRLEAERLMGRAGPPEAQNWRRVTRRMPSHLHPATVANLIVVAASSRRRGCCSSSRSAPGIARGLSPLPLRGYAAVRG